MALPGSAFLLMGYPEAQGPAGDMGTCLGSLSLTT